MQLGRRVTSLALCISIQQNAFINKKKEVLTQATWINLEDIIQSERSQSQQVTYFMIVCI